MWQTCQIKTFTYCMQQSQPKGLTMSVSEPPTFHIKVSAPRGTIDCQTKGWMTFRGTLKRRLNRIGLSRQKVKKKKGQGHVHTVSLSTVWTHFLSSPLFKKMQWNLEFFGTFIYESYSVFKWLCMHIEGSPGNILNITNTPKMHLIRMQCCGHLSPTGNNNSSLSVLCIYILL